MPVPTNDAVKQFVDAATRQFQPNSAQVLDSRVPEHFTVVARLPERIVGELEKLSEQLKRLDASIELTPPEQYHLTISSFEVTCDPESAKAVIKQIMQTAELSFELTGLALDPKGVVCKAYPASDCLLQIRRDVHALTGHTEPDLTVITSEVERFLTSWVTLARFAQPISRQLIDYVASHQDDQFGTVTCDTLLCYKSSHRMLIGAQLAW